MRLKNEINEKNLYVLQNTAKQRVIYEKCMNQASKYQLLNVSVVYKQIRTTK